MIAPRSYSNRRGLSRKAWAPPLFVVLLRIPAAPLTHVAPARAHGRGEHRRPFTPTHNRNLSPSLTHSTPAAPGSTRGAAPVTSRCTRYVALHPLRRDTPDQKGCNAYGSGAPPPTTSTTAKTFRLARSRAGCPSATGAALLSQFSSPGPGRPAATWRGERPQRRHPDPCRTGHLR